MASRSEQIIKKYCGSVEDRIAACCDKQVAEYLKQNIYGEIRQNCKSESVLEFARQYVENLVQARFKTRKN